MNILVIGSGGREHALVWAIKKSPRVKNLFCIPGNAGIAQACSCCESIPLLPGYDQLLGFLEEKKIDLIVIGPEDPLIQGLADVLIAHGFRCFGPQKAAAMLEGSKAFAKEIMNAAGVPAAASHVFEDVNSAIEHLQNAKYPLVIKADGNAAGKGVSIHQEAQDAVEKVERIMIQNEFGMAGERVVIEEYLSGEEASILAFVDAETIVPMVASQDHKAVFDGDAGPNTGGMGAYSPIPLVNDEDITAICENILKPVVAELKNRGILYRGVLYAGLMIDAAGEFRVLEFNCRFGDPETQVVIPRLASDIVEILDAVASDRLGEVSVEWKEQSAVCVVLASGGYPGEYQKGKVITGLDAVEGENTVVFHAGTRLEDGKILTNGGRVLGITTLGDSLEESIRRNYEAVQKISFEGMQYRTDIGNKGLRRLNR